MKVSVIVPVYNAEQFLDRCIASILVQTHSNLELLLINDGSTDLSREICDKWQQIDPRVVVIHQSNQGVSAARNAGLDIATGDFIGFVDADDEIAPETYETALSDADGHDIVMWDAVTVWSDGRTEPDSISLLNTNRVITKEDWTPKLLREMAGAVWRCIYHCDLVQNLRFPLGIKFSEDRIFNLYAMGRAKSLHYLKRPFYYRLMHSQSAVHRYHEDYFETYLKAYTATIEALDAYWYEIGYHRVNNSHLVGGALGAIYNYFCNTSSLPFSQRIKKTKAVCKNEILRKALENCNTVGLRVLLLRYKCVLTLCVAAILWNLKNRR